MENFDDRGRAAERLITQLSRRAGIAIGIERAWSALIAFFVVIGLFVIVSWLGLWLVTPDWARMLGLAIFATGLVWPARLAIGFRAPTRNEALDRIDRDSGLRHRPAAALADSLAGSGRDALSQSLWLAHRRSAEKTSQSFKVNAPQVKTGLHDRFALRGAVLIALVAAGFVAGSEKNSRLWSAFQFGTVSVAGPDNRIDVWIDPPAYTGRPPTILKMPPLANELSQPIQAPVGSTLVVRSSHGSSITIEISGQLTPLTEAIEAQGGASSGNGPKRSLADEHRFMLGGDSRLTIRQGGPIAGFFQLVAIADNPPSITLIEEPKSNGRGLLSLSYRIADDYGIVSAEAEFSNPRVRNKPPASRQLVEAPRLPLGLPSGAGNSGNAETSADLSEHAWAGARVTMVLTARDEAGNIGKTDHVEILLPERPFLKPLARALVEQRRNLALAPLQKSQVALSIEALMIEPDQFATSAGQYLGLRAIAARLARSKNDDDLRSALDLMWEMALRIEEGDITSAERDLKAAQQELRGALERGADDEDIRRLMDQLRAAMDRYLQEFADKQARDQDQANRDGEDQQPSDRTITSQDLRRMLDRMEDMARSGNAADAQRMLNDLQNLLENLKSARRGGDPQAREMNRSLNQLDQMMRDQQDLRDRTFRQNPQGLRPGDKPNENGQQSGSEPNEQSLRQNQEALRRRLEDLQRRMRQFGMKPEQGLDDAESAMRDAEGELGEGQPRKGQAVEAQGRALEGLRKGAESMAKQMQPGDQPGQQSGEGGPGGKEGRQSASPDPLGRESRNRGDQSRTVYDPMGEAGAQRAQRVLEELRKRLGDPARTRDELDYIERLLRRY